MPRRKRARQVPKASRARVKGPVKGSHIGQPDTPEHMQAAAIARRYARCDRQFRPIHCFAQSKLMYDTQEQAQAAAVELAKLDGGPPDHAYECFRGGHWHLTSMDQSHGAAS